MPPTESAPYYGPKVRFDPDTGNRSGIEFDPVGLGENLQRDFPELTAEDWGKVTLVYRDLGNEDWGGLTADVGTMRASRSLRFLVKSSNLLVNLITKRPIVSLRKLEKMSDGADILVQVNTKAKIEGIANDHYSDDQPIDLATITAHELKHAADDLLSTKANAHQLDKIKKLSRSGARHLGVFALGIATTAAGLFEYYLRLTQKSNEKVLLDKPFLLVIAGLAIAASPVVAVAKYDSLTYKRFGIESKEPPYATGENAANAYSVATRANWENVIYEKSQD